MRVRAAYTEKRRQMRFTRRQFPSAFNLKAIIMLDSGIYYGHAGRINVRIAEGKS